MSKGVARNEHRNRIEEPVARPQLAYTVPDGARLLGVGVSSMYAMRKKGLVKFTTIAGRRVITHAELERVLAAAEAGDPAHRSGRIHDPISPTEEDRPEG